MEPHYISRAGPSEQAPFDPGPVRDPGHLRLAAGDHLSYQSVSYKTVRSAPQEALPPSEPHERDARGDGDPAENPGDVLDVLPHAGGDTFLRDHDETPLLDPDAGDPLVAEKHAVTGIGRRRAIGSTYPGDRRPAVPFRFSRPRGPPPPA